MTAAIVAVVCAAQGLWVEMVAGVACIGIGSWCGAIFSTLGDDDR